MIPSAEDLKALRRNGYIIDKVIGKGAYAEVHAAKHLRTYTGSPILLACKIFNKNKVPKYFSEKFLPREMEILQNINHENLITAHSMIQIGSLIYIFTLLAENGDLLDYINDNGIIPEDQSKVWFRQMVNGLDYLHRNNIAHRDLKCENILITENFVIKITDFGFSRYCCDENGNAVLSKTYCGSSAYAAPEIVKGIPYNPKIADIWSLGVILYMILNGAMPFDDKNSKKFLRDQMTRNFSFRTNAVSPKAKFIVHKILNPNVSKRMSLTELKNHEWLRETECKIDDDIEEINCE